MSHSCIEEKEPSFMKSMILKVQLHQAVVQLAHGLAILVWKPVSIWEDIVKLNGLVVWLWSIQIQCLGWCRMSCLDLFILVERYSYETTEWLNLIAEILWIGGRQLECSLEWLGLMASFCTGNNHSSISSHAFSCPWILSIKPHSWPTLLSLM